MNEMMLALEAMVRRVVQEELNLRAPHTLSPTQINDAFLHFALNEATAMDAIMRTSMNGTWFVNAVDNRLVEFLSQDSPVFDKAVEEAVDGANWMKDMIVSELPAGEDSTAEQFANRFAVYANNNPHGLSSLIRETLNTTGWLDDKITDVIGDTAFTVRVN